MSKESIMNLSRDEHNTDVCEFRVLDTEFICLIDGRIFRKMKTSNWKEVKNTQNHNKGYNVIVVNKKQYSRAKLILYAYGKISLTEKNKNIYHKNADRLDCHLDNLTTDVLKV